MNSLCLVFLTLTLADPPEPTVKECIDGFRKNFDSFKSLKIHWRRENSKTDDWVLLQAKAIAELVKKINGMQQTDKDYHTLQQQLQGMRNSLAYSRLPKALNQIYYTDRLGFQLRSMNVDWGSMADDPATWTKPFEGAVESLSASSSRVPVTIVSYTGDPADGFRTWTSQPQGVMGHGQIMKQMPYGETNYFPPLGISKVSSSGNTNQTLVFISLWNEIDGFFETTKDTLLVAGRTRIDGHDTVILEKYTWYDPGKPSKERNGTLIRAFVDPSRGFLPLRTEWWTAQEVDGKVKPREANAKAYQVLDVTKIDQIPGAGFYPMKGSHKQFIADPKFNGDSSLAPYVLSEETTWLVGSLVANQPLDVDFEITFPKGVYYYDERIGQNIQSGFDPAAARRLPWILCGVILCGWAIFAFAMLILTLIRRKQRRTALVRMARVP